MVAGDGVGEDELVVASGVGGDGGYGNQGLCDVIGVVERNECFGDGGAVGGESSGEGDVAAGELLRRGGGGSDGSGDGDELDDHIGAHGGLVGRVARIGRLIARRAWRRLFNLEREAAAFISGHLADIGPESVDVAVQLNQGVCHPRAVGHEPSCDGDVAPDELLSWGGDSGDCCGSGGPA